MRPYVKNQTGLKNMLSVSQFLGIVICWFHGLDRAGRPPRGL